VGRVVIRLHENDSLFDALGRIAAARVAGCTPVISLPEGLHNAVTDFLKGPEGKRIVGAAAMVRQTDWSGPWPRSSGAADTAAGNNAHEIESGPAWLRLRELSVAVLSRSAQPLSPSVRQVRLRQKRAKASPLPWWSRPRWKLSHEAVSLSSQRRGGTQPSASRWLSPLAAQRRQARYQTQ
jgi:hypothetical protein